MTYKNDSYTLSTGRKFYANHGILGISPGEGFDEEYFGCSEGYDGSVSTRDWTPEERRELADAMIAVWTEFKS